MNPSVYFFSLFSADYLNTSGYLWAPHRLVRLLFLFLHVAQIVLCHFQTVQLFVLLKITNKLLLVHVSAEHLT